MNQQNLSGAGAFRKQFMAFFRVIAVRAPLKGCYSEKTGKTYDASVLLEDDGQRTGYKMMFDNG